MLRSAFIKLSESKGLRGFAENSAMGRRFSQRFVAGTRLQDAVRATEEVNTAGASVSVDNLGENVTNADEAKRECRALSPDAGPDSSRKLNANISLKLTHMGFDVERGPGFRLVTELVAHAVEDQQLHSRGHGRLALYADAPWILCASCIASRDTVKIGTVIQSISIAVRKTSTTCSLNAYAFGCAKALTKNRRRLRSPRKRTSMPIT